MIKIENIDIWGFEHAIRGMRNPMNSWNKSDSSYFKNTIFCEDCEKKCDEYNKNIISSTEHYGCFEDLYCIGENDLDLMRRLYNAGTEHRKYLRQILVSMDITAPLYWWKEMDTYKFVLPDPKCYDTNSCSTMHKIHAKEFTMEDFSFEYLSDDVIENPVKTVIDCLNFFRGLYLQHKEKDDWYTMIQLLPSSYNQKRTITMNYENVVSIIKQRSGHKLDEWNTFVEVLKDLPYVKEIIGEQ